MVLKHHTLSPFDRKPQGAVAAGGQVRLRVTAEGDQTSLELFLRVWNGAERRYPMRSLGVRNGKTVYEAQIGVGDTPNLLWYRFEGETREGRSGRPYRMRRRRDGQRGELSGHGL